MEDCHLHISRERKATTLWYVMMAQIVICWCKPLGIITGKNILSVNWIPQKHHLFWIYVPSSPAPPPSVPPWFKVLFLVQLKIVKILQKRTPITSSGFHTTMITRLPSAPFPSVSSVPMPPWFKVLVCVEREKSLTTLRNFVFWRKQLLDEEGVDSLTWRSARIETKTP